MNKSVLACAHGDWHLQIWDKENPQGTTRHIPWSCRSWRHPGECRRWKGSQDFARVAEAMKSSPKWSYLVLTFAQGEWPDKWLQYKSGVSLWAKMRKRITRRYGPMEYIQTWERHKKGGAHVNVIIKNNVLFDQLEGDFKKVLREFMKPAAIECGFGWRTWVDTVYGREGMAGYLTKLSRELTGADGKDQIPEDAPPHFRRIRASRKTLPPIKRTDLTGIMRFCPLESWVGLSQEEKGKEVERYYGPGPKFIGTKIILT